MNKVATEDWFNSDEKVNSIADLAYRFAISTSTTSAVLKWMLKLPSRDDSFATTPMSFQQHFKTEVAVIVDCLAKKPYGKSRNIFLIEASQYSEDFNWCDTSGCY